MRSNDPKTKLYSFVLINCILDNSYFTFEQNDNMIKINELRQGNLVQTYKGEVIEWDFSLMAAGVNKLFKSEDNSEVTVDPLPLTQGWLKSLGFDSRMINGVVPEWYIMCTPPNYKREFSLFFRFGCMINTPQGVCDGQGWHPYMNSGDSHSFNIQSIHQLQNVYFFITGEELKLKQAL